MACLRRFSSHTHASQSFTSILGYKEHLQSKAVIHSPVRTVAHQISGPATCSLSHTLHTATAASQSQSKNLERIAQDFLNLTKIERHDYILFRLNMGLNRYGPAVSGVGPASFESGSTPTDSKVVEKTAFNIKLENFDASTKIKIIKEVRIFTDLGLKGAKDLVEEAPVVLKKGVTKEEAGSIVDKLGVGCFCGIGMKGIPLLLFLLLLVEL